MGIGTAIQHGGAYYGTLAVEKRSAEALEQARTFQLDDRQEGYDRQDTLRAEDAEADSAAAAAARELALADRDEQRGYNEGLTNEQRQYEEQRELTAAEQDAVDAAETGARVESVPRSAEDSTIVRRLFNSKGEAIADLGEDRDYVVGDDGTTQRLSGGGTGATEKSQTEMQIKLELNATNLDNGMGIMADVLGLEGEAGEGYDLRSASAMADMVTQKIGGAANWLTSEEGQRFNAGLRMAGEAMFKGLSGAAGSDAEAQRFYNMFPAPGDTPDVVRLKMGMMQKSLDAFEKAAGMNDVDDRVMYVRAITQATALESGFNLDTGKFRAASNSTVGPTQDQSFSLTPEEQALYDEF